MSDLERLFNMIVFTLQSVRSVPTVRRKPSADLFHLSLSLSLSCQQLRGQLLERRAAGLTVAVSCDYLSLWAGNNNNSELRTENTDKPLLSFLIEGDCETRTSQWCAGLLVLCCVDENNQPVSSEDRDEAGYHHHHVKTSMMTP